MFTKQAMQRLIQQLVSADESEREAARLAFYQMDEDAIEPLSSEFYAGVNETLGLAIIDVVSAIGGPEALSLLLDVYHFNERAVWKNAARAGLVFNNQPVDDE